MTLPLPQPYTVVAEITVVAINAELTDEMEIITQAKRKIREWAMGKSTDGTVGVGGVRIYRAGKLLSGSIDGPTPADS